MSCHLHKKRICFITTLPITLVTFVRQQTDSLIYNGWDVTWVCSEDTGFHHKIPEGVKLITLPFKRGIDLWGVPKAILSLYLLFKRENFNIVQYSTPNAAFYASTAALFASIPVRLYAQWGIRYVGFRGGRRVFFKLLEHWCCYCKTNIEPDSLSNLEFSIKEGLYSRNKGKVIWNGSASGVNLEQFDITKKDGWRTEYRKKLNIGPHHLVIGFVGSIRRDKGCNELLSACRSFFSDFPNLRLILVGDKTFFYTVDESLQEWAIKSKQVIFIYPNDEIPQYMACMNILSLPSYREGFGSVVIEAEAMGVPVVVSNIPGPIDAMRHGLTGLIVPVKNSEALAAALKKLLNDTNMRLNFEVAAVLFASNSFDQKEFMKLVVQDKEGLL